MTVVLQYEGSGGMMVVVLQWYIMTQIGAILDAIFSVATVMTDIFQNN